MVWKWFLEKVPNNYNTPGIKKICQNLTPYLCYQKLAYDCVYPGDHRNRSIRDKCIFAFYAEIPIATKMAGKHFLDKR